MEDLTAAVFDFFAERHIALRQEWLCNVLSFLQSRSLGFQNPRNIAALVFEQWKYADLTDSSYPILHQLIKDDDTSKATFNHPVVMQIVSIADIGAPYHLQYATLVYEFVDDTGFEPSPEMERNGRTDFCEASRRRMLLLTVGDGEDNLRAVEYHTISSLSLLTKPGCKFLLLPPVQCRKGVLLLKPECIQIIGGDVESLFATGRPLAVITRKLGITMSNSSRGCNEQSSAESCVELPLEQNSAANSDVFPLLQPPAVDKMQRFAQCVERTSVSLRRSRIKPVAQVSPIHKVRASSPIDLEESPPDFDAELEMLRSRTSVPQAVAYQERHSSASRRSILAACEDYDIIGTNNHKSENCGSGISQSLPASKRAKGNEGLAPSKKIKVEVVTIDDDGYVPSQGVPHPTNSTSYASQDLLQTSQMQQPRDDELPSVTKFRFLNIARLADATRLMRFAVGSCRKVVQVIILDIVDSLRIVDGMWTMKISIQDESTDRLVCIVDNSSLISLIGLTPQEAMEIRASSDVDRRRDGQRRLAAVETQLKRLDLLLELELFSGGRADPVIRSIQTLVQALDLL